MPQNRLDRRLENHFDGNQIVDAGFGEKHIFLDHVGHRVPFRFPTVRQMAAVAEKIKQQDHGDDKGGVEAVAQGTVVECGAGQDRRRQQGFGAEGDEGRIGNQSQKDEPAVVLVEKDIGQILFVGVFPQPHGRIIDVLEMIVENHLPGKGQIQDDGVHRDSGCPHGVADGFVRGEKGAGQADADPGEQEDIGVVVHAPPESVPEAGQPFFLMGREVFFRPVDTDKNPTKQGTEQRCHDHEFPVLLGTGEKGRKHEISSIR